MKYIAIIIMSFLLCSCNQYKKEIILFYNNHEINSITTQVLLKEDEKTFTVLQIGISGGALYPPIVYNKNESPITYKFTGASILVDIPLFEWEY